MSNAAWKNRKLVLTVKGNMDLTDGYDQTFEVQTSDFGDNTRGNVVRVLYDLGEAFHSRFHGRTDGSDVDQPVTPSSDLAP
jgi:hypothetical protein